MFDCHIHSSFSTDSCMEALTACESAIKAGLTGIAFTDHFDFDFPGTEGEFLFDLNLYQRYMDNIKVKYKSRLNVLKGIEIGIQPHVIDKSLKLVEKYDFDFILASVHLIDGMDPYSSGFYDGKTKNESYLRYLEEVFFVITHFSDFDVTAHLDYIIRYAGYDDRSLRYSDFRDILDMIFKELVSKGRGLEINTGTYKERNSGIRLPEFDIELLKRYRQLGGEVITLGSDSHSPEYIGYKFDLFNEKIKSAGFKYIAHFENRKPVFTPV